MTEKNPRYALVAFPIPVYREFAYRIPRELQDSLAAGSLVSAPFRNGVKTGFVTGFTEEAPPGEIKDVQDLLIDVPVFTDDLRELARWMSAYYFTSPGDIMHTMLPVKINRESVEIITPGEAAARAGGTDKKPLNPLEQRILDVVRTRKRVTPQALKQAVGYYQLFYRIDRLRRGGHIHVEQAVAGKKIAPRMQVFLKPALRLAARKQDEVFSRAPAQKAVYRYIVEHSPVPRTSLLRRFPGRGGAVNALVQKNLVTKYMQEAPREFAAELSGGGRSLPELTAAQRAVVDAVTIGGVPGKFGAFLLHGVTGSGKTRVYLELIRTALNRGRGALFLLPEIALTNYFLAALREQFGDAVAILHSRMSPGERYDSWRGMLGGKKRLAIGPRSAVFAPVKNLGLVIVDEEHDASYKQHESPPYYHARDVAVYRARINNAAVLLGSATPSMESYYNAQSGKYRLLELPDRIDRTPLPEVRLVDLRRKRGEPFRGKRPIFSAELLDALRERLKRDEQVLLMLNRRGFATFVQCGDCGYIETCPDCRITLTFHKRYARMQCHFCGHVRKAPVECPECRGGSIRYTGVGTQQVEEALAELVPGYRTVRMDQDTTRSKSGHRFIAAQFEQGASDIMVGTQMIAKGFDFGRVNLVGVISADTGLLMPEFRAAEKTFQLMTQAAGRAGRRKERGIVIIQTLHPEHYSLTAACGHDFRRFYGQESKLRAELGYPPHGRIVLLRFFSRDEDAAAGAATGVGQALRRSRYRRFVLGPSPAPIGKIRKLYRWQIFLKSGKAEDRNGAKIHAAAQLARQRFNALPEKRHAAMTIDVDPVSVL